MIVLSETWVVENKNLYSLPDYNIIYNQGNLNKNDGVVMYIKNSHIFSSKIVYINNIKVIQVTLNYYNKIRIMISADYRSPSTDAGQFAIELRSYLKSSSGAADIHILVGDLNIDILDADARVCDYLNVLGEAGFVSAINKATRIQNLSQTCIGHLFLKTRSATTHKIIPTVLETNITDHFSIATKILFTNNFSSRKTLDLSNSIIVLI